MHVTDGRHQLSHDAAGLRFAEMLLPANPLQQFSSTQQLQNQICVKLRRINRTVKFPPFSPAFILNIHLVQTKQILGVC